MFYHFPPVILYVLPSNLVDLSFSPTHLTPRRPATPDVAPPLPPPPAGAALQPLAMVEAAAARRRPPPLPPPNPLSSIPNLHSTSLYISRVPPFPPEIYLLRSGIATACAPSSSGHFIPVPPLPCTAVLLVAAAAMGRPQLAEAE
jgi:hypothetical protein